MERGETLYFSENSGFETARQAATSAERHALTIAPCPSQISIKFKLKGLSESITIIISHATNDDTSILSSTFTVGRVKKMYT